MAMVQNGTETLLKISTGQTTGGFATAQTRTYNVYYAKSTLRLFYCSICFISLHMKPPLKTEW